MIAVIVIGMDEALALVDKVDPTIRPHSKNMRTEMQADREHKLAFYFTDDWTWAGWDREEDIEKSHGPNVKRIPYWEYVSRTAKPERKFSLEDTIIF